MSMHSALSFLPILTRVGALALPIPFHILRLRLYPLHYVYIAFSTAYHSKELMQRSPRTSHHATSHRDTFCRLVCHGG